MNPTWNILREHVKNLLLILAAAALTAGCFSSVEPPQPTSTSPPLSPTAPVESPTVQTSPPEKPTTPSPTIEPTETARPEPVRVILFIGDGMGAEHRQAAAWMGFGRDGQLVMDGLKVHGSLRTSSVGNQVTDSAAAATALASGVKTRNGLVGLNPDGEEVITAFDRAQELGLAVGLVTNTPLPHATPAGFAAHSENRWDMNGIAPQLLEAEVDVLLGGGENYFLPTGSQGCHPEPGKREDGRNLVAEAQKSSYHTLCRPEELAALETAGIDRLLGVFADEGIPRPFQPSLAEMTSAAVEVLSQDPEGFFLVVESGQIDWASHGNVAANAILDTLALDEAVRVGLDFADCHANTLLIVTADHETGGMDTHSQPTGNAGEDGPFTGLGEFVFYVTWTTKTHTSALVPVTAQGPGAYILEGENDITAVYHAVLEALAVRGEPVLQ